MTTDIEAPARPERGEARRPGRLARLRAELGPVANLLMFGAGVVVIDRVLRDYLFGEVTAALANLPAAGLIACTVLTVGGYVALAGYDFVAFRTIGHDWPFRRVLLPSFVSFAVANSAPASVVTGGGVRYRLYRRQGLTAEQATAVAAFNVVTYCAGLFLLGGAALLAAGSSGAGPFAGGTARPVGAILLAAPLAYLLLTWRRPGPVSFGRFRVRVPAVRTAAAQLAVSLADWLLSSGALYVLLRTTMPVGYAPFLAAFLVAQAAALLLPVPGGVGVFEAVVLLLRPAGTPAPVVLAVLLAYRVLYFLLPLLLAGAVYVWLWSVEARAAGDPGRQAARQLRRLAPTIIAFITFLAGMLLLGSGAIPQSDERLAWLNQVLPLAVIEASHLLGSIAGAMLIVLAWGIERRSRTAYRIVRALFALGILLTLGRSVDLRLAALMALLFAVLLLAGSAFPRPESLVREPMSARWSFAVGGIFILEVWLITLLYRHTELRGEVWWRFAFSAQAPRALRAAVAAAVIILLFGLVRVVARRNSPPAPK